MVKDWVTPERWLTPRLLANLVVFGPFVYMSLSWAWSKMSLLASKFSWELRCNAHLNRPLYFNNTTVAKFNYKFSISASTKSVFFRKISIFNFLTKFIAITFLSLAKIKQVEIKCHVVLCHHVLRCIPNLHDVGFICTFCNVEET